MDDQVRKTIAKYLEDMHSLESHGLQAVSRQLNETKGGNEHPEARRVIETFRTTLQGHITALEARMKAVDAGSTSSPTTKIQDAASAVAGVVAGLYNQIRTERVSKSIRDDYTFWSHVTISYLTLHTTSMGLGDQETGALAERGYRDAARMVMEINDIMPQLVVREMQQDGLPMRDVSQECHDLIRDAWAQPAERAGLTT